MDFINQAIIENPEIFYLGMIIISTICVCRLFSNTDMIEVIDEDNQINRRKRKRTNRFNRQINRRRRKSRYNKDNIKNIFYNYNIVKPKNKSDDDIMMRFVVQYDHMGKQLVISKNTVISDGVLNSYINNNSYFDYFEIETTRNPYLNIYTIYYNITENDEQTNFVVFV